MSSLNLKVGDIVRLRNGDITRIENHSAGYEYPFSSGLLTWTRDGRYTAEGEHHWDIVENLTHHTKDGHRTTIVSRNLRGNSGVMLVLIHHPDGDAYGLYSKKTGRSFGVTPDLVGFEPLITKTLTLPASEWAKLEQ